MRRLSDQTVDEGTTTEVAISVSDPDEDPITPTVTGLPPFASFVDSSNGTGTIKISPTFDDVGEYPGVEITAADAEESVSETITIIVNNVNRPPICDVTEVDAIECPGPVTTVALDGSASSDPGGDSLTYLWEADCPEGSFDDPTSPTPIFSVDTSCACAITCEVTLTIDDGTDTDS